MTKTPFGLLLALLTFVLIQGAHAVEGDSVFKNHDADLPIDIVADSLQLDQEKRLAVFEGKVEAVQGQLKFMTETLRVYYESEAGNKNLKIARLDATGHVRLESPVESAEGNWAVYDVKSRTITVVGDVILKREDSEFKGERLEINLDTGVTKFDGQTIEGTPEDDNRVKGRFALPDDSK